MKTRFLKTAGLAILLALCPMVPSFAQASGASVESLFSQRFASREALQDAIEQAREAGASEQNLLEAKVLFEMFSGDGSRAMALKEEVSSLRAEWDFSDSRLAASEDSLKAMSAVLAARHAMFVSDAESMKAAVGEAFWYEPQLAQILMQWVETFKNEQAMASIVLPMDTPFLVASGGETTLGDLLDGNKALLLDFWASWCGPCMQLMPALKEKAEKFEKEGVAVAAVNRETATEALPVKAQFGFEIPWLVEPEKQELGQTLRIDSIPRMVLISPEGKILFNGHPQSPELLTAIAKVTGES